jgi:hypothetical protein
MVEHRIRDPQILEIEEASTDFLTPQRGGSCLICNGWIDAEEHHYDVAISSQEGRLDGVCHASCLAGTTHPTFALPGDDADRGTKHRGV